MGIFKTDEKSVSFTGCTFSVPGQTVGSDIVNARRDGSSIEVECWLHQPWQVGTMQVACMHFDIEEGLVAEAMQNPDTKINGSVDMEYTAGGSRQVNAEKPTDVELFYDSGAHVLSLSEKSMHIKLSVPLSAQDSDQLKSNFNIDPDKYVDKKHDDKDDASNLHPQETDDNVHVNGDKHGALGTGNTEEDQEAEKKETDKDKIMKDKARAMSRGPGEDMKRSKRSRRKH